ncbi:MAG: Maf-like protein [marine bacterium B5-7]|nr:MAG: Maf-like protein [marine bacterium B5-7]
MATPIIADPTICLASTSPRRRELLSQIGVRFIYVDPAIDEENISAPTARQQVLEIARAKACAGINKEPLCCVLAADTVVICDDKALGKPVDRDDAMRMLALLSGRSHWVYTAVVTLFGDKTCHAVSATEVWLRATTIAERARYADSGEPFDKAGGYAIQGRAAEFIARIEGSYSNVVGLPLFETANLLNQQGINL